MHISTPRSNLIVRFLAVFLICCSSVYASSEQTGKQKVTVVATDATLESVFKQIEKQTGLRFMYAVDALDVKEKVTVAFEKVTLDEVLESLLGKRGIEWVYREGVISLKYQSGITINANATFNLILGPPVTISGKVLDAKGNPVPFATIMVKGTKRGTKTDADGLFILPGIEINDALLVSSVGFETKEIIVKDRNLTIKMDEEVGVLDEKVVKGYYTTTGRLNTGSIVTVRSEDIDKQPVSDPLLALQGRVPGMLISQTTGLQGGQVNVEIRGRNSLGSGTVPLFIVDGVPYEPNVGAAPFGTFGALSSVISALNFLNPADIETIDVLKDADATSIYGSRGANGVVLITTKRGKVGEVKINLSFNRGWQTLNRWTRLLNTQQYLELRREAFKNDGIEPTRETAPDLLKWDTTRYTDWQKALLGGTSGYTDCQANVSGGNTSVQYLIGGNFHKETTPYPGDFYSQRGGGHFNIIGNSGNQRLRVSLTSSYVSSETNYPGLDFARFITLSPNAPTAYTKEGALNWDSSTWSNPYVGLISSVLDGSNSNMVTNVEASYSFSNGLTVKANIGYNELRTNSFMGTTIAGVDPLRRQEARASASFLDTKRRSWISEPQISYKRSFDESYLDLLMGITLLSNVNDGQHVLASGILQDALIRFPEAANAYNVWGAGSKYKYIAFFGRMGYNVMDKYLLNVTIRRDGSSRFGPNKQFATFWSVGAGWVFSEERFIKDNIPTLSFGKLRASLGITGNDQVGDYQYLDQYMFVQQTYQGEKGLRVNGLFNPNFEWEKTKKGEVGLELGVFKDRLLLTANFYKNSSNNQLLPYRLPSMVGGTYITGNLPALIHNSGLEVLITSKNIQRMDFGWTSTFNISFPKNKLVRMEGLDRALVVGKSLSSRYLYKMNEVEPNTGTYLFADVNGKSVTINNDADPRYTTIDLAPVFLGGLQNGLKFKNFQLDIFLQYVKQEGREGLFSFSAIPGSRSNVSIAALSRWREKGDNVNIQRANQNYSLNEAFYAWLNSDQAYGDASFIRCKNISLSWDLPGSIRRRLQLNNCRIYVQCQNLFTITKYEGWDPETQSLESIPPLRTLVFGAQIGF